MPTFATADGTELHYKDWGEGPPVVFSHAWPLNADAWDNALHAVAAGGRRAVAHDRRGHGRSGQPWHGHDMDTYADDLAALLDHLDLRGAVLVGHAAGGGEAVRHLARHGGDRVAGLVLVGAVPPLLVRTPDNPDGVPVETLDAYREGVAKDRSQFYRDLGETFYGANRSDHGVSAGTREAFWLWAMRTCGRAAHAGVAAFAETDFTADLARVAVPTLVAHGGDDQIVPAATAARTAGLVPGATLKVYPGAPHGLTGHYEDLFTADLLAFLDAHAPQGALRGGQVRHEVG